MAPCHRDRVACSNPLRRPRPRHRAPVRQLARTRRGAGGRTGSSPSRRSRCRASPRTSRPAASSSAEKPPTGCVAPGAGAGSPSGTAANGAGAVASAASSARASSDGWAPARGRGRAGAQLRRAGQRHALVADHRTAEDRSMVSRRYSCGQFVEPLTVIRDTLGTPRQRMVGLEEMRVAVEQQHRPPERACVLLEPRLIELEPRKIRRRRGSHMSACSPDRDRGRPSCPGRGEDAIDPPQVGRLAPLRISVMLIGHNPGCSSSRWTWLGPRPTFRSSRRSIRLRRSRRSRSSPQLARDRAGDRGAGRLRSAARA